MDDVTTATEALEQALRDNLNGDDSSIQQDGQPSQPLKVTPVDQPEAPKAKKDTALTNDEAKKQRISNAEWQKMQEDIQQSKALKEKLAAALIDAPDAVRKEDDLPTQVSKLNELIRRRDWEAQHPIVRSEKYDKVWAEVNENPRYRDLGYDERWKLIKDESSSSKIKEELKAQQMESYGSVPIASKSPARASNVLDSQAAEYLRQAGFTEKDIIDNA